MCILKLYIRGQLEGVTKLNISQLILNNTFNNLYDESPYICLDLVQPSPKRNLFLLIYDPFPQSASPGKQKLLNVYAPLTHLQPTILLPCSLLALHFCPYPMDCIWRVCLWSTLKITILSQCTAFSQTHCSLKSLHMAFKHSHTVSNALKERPGERPKGETRKRVKGS